MSISASDVMKLRAMTGAGMMDCKNALEEAGGDMEKAADLLRKKGVVKAAKRADKVAADGVIMSAVSSDQKVGALVEVNSETDFVAKSPDFLAFATEVAEVIRDQQPKGLEGLHALTLKNGKTVEATMSELTLKIGEKITVRRFMRYESEGGSVAVYVHGSKIGTMVEVAPANVALGAEVALHIAAARPKYLNREMVDATELNREKDIYAEQLRAQKKPENIIENIVKGKLDKFYSEVCLLEQPFIKDEEVTVGKLAEKQGVKIVQFERYELGEGMEKVTKDFASEVAEQLK
ncbi:MAG TPA: translation elongation factor Ts [Patescibacteria group bacterium]|nr:translation elongation factor Ts [Patescibacteria group bacterium]